MRSLHIHSESICKEIAENIQTEHLNGNTFYCETKKRIFGDIETS